VREFVCSEKEENVIQRKNLRNTAYIVCSEKMAMECRQVSTKVNRETRERLGRSAKRSAAVRGQAGRGGTVARRCLPGAAEQNVGLLACQVLWLTAGRSASSRAVCRASSFMCATHLSCHISFLEFLIRIFQESHTT
jgi:hypothetical protein